MCSDVSDVSVQFLLQHLLRRFRRFRPIPIPTLLRCSDVSDVFLFSVLLNPLTDLGVIVSVGLLLPCHLLLLPPPYATTFIRPYYSSFAPDPFPLLSLLL
jgi:hypothetical protein